MEKIVWITGGGSGIGLAAAKALRDAGCRVYETSRHETATPGVVHLSGDVTEESAMARCAETILAREGRLDVLVCCAGFGISGAVEFTRLEDAKRQLDVNFFGCVNAVKAVLPAMRRQGSGRILVVSSVAGAIPIPFQTYYSVSKAALNAYISALRSEVRPYGITACAVMPGDIRTGFTDARQKESAGAEEYGGRIEHSVAGMEKDERGGMDPDVPGRFLCRLALRKSVPPACTVGGRYKLFVALARFLPARLVNYLVYCLYAK